VEAERPDGKRIGFDSLHGDACRKSLPKSRGQTYPAVEDTQIDLTDHRLSSRPSGSPKRRREMAGYRAPPPAAQKGEPAGGSRANWDRPLAGAAGAGESPCWQLDGAETMPKRCGFSRIKPEKPNLVGSKPAWKNPPSACCAQGFGLKTLHGRPWWYQGGGPAARPKCWPRALQCAAAGQAARNPDGVAHPMASQSPRLTTHPGPTTGPISGRRTRRVWWCERVLRPNSALAAKVRYNCLTSGKGFGRN